MGVRGASGRRRASEPWPGDSSALGPPARGVSFAAAAGPLWNELRNGAWPRMTRNHALAQLESRGASRMLAARSAAAKASSKLRAPPAEASGARKGRRRGAAVHQAAQRKRRRRVIAMEHPGANNSEPLGALSREFGSSGADISVGVLLEDRFESSRMAPWGVSTHRAGASTTTNLRRGHELAPGGWDAKRSEARNQATDDSLRRSVHEAGVHEVGVHELGADDPVSRL